MRRRLGVDYDRYHFIDASRESRERVKIAELLPTFFVFVFCFFFLFFIFRGIFIVDFHYDSGASRSACY